MRTTRRPLFAAMSLSSALVALSLACGGGQGGDAKAPGTPNATGPAASGEGTDTSAAPAGGDEGAQATATTTTTALPDGGELQGAKLGSASRKEIETKGESGPKPGGPSSEPGRTRQDIQARIASVRDEARACYDKGLKDHPGIEGDLDVKWVIAPDGAVTDVEVDTTKSQIVEPSVGKCVVEVIKKLKFAPSQKGFETRAHYPFNFHPRNFKGDAGR